MFDYAGEDMFVTLFYGVLDPERRTLVYANGGHEPPLFYNHQSRWAMPLDVTGRAVAIARESTFGQMTLEFAPGDVLLVYTDGITDARSHGQFFGTDGLTEVFMANVENDERVIVDTVFEAAFRAGEGHLPDDAAVVVLKTRFDSD